MPESDNVHRSFGVTVRSLNEEARTVDVIASTDSIDSYGEIVDQEWDLKRYLRNPVVLYHHNREGWVEALEPKYTLPIGRASNVGVVDGKLQATLNFVDEKASPMAEYVWQGFKQGSLRAVSVGFTPRNRKYELIEGKEVCRLSDNELFEISVCPMGANPDAVAKAAAETKRAREAKADEPQPPQPVVATAPATTEKNIMTEAEIQALREKLATAELSTKTAATDLEAARTSLAAKTAEGNALTERLTLATTQLTAMTERATAAEARAAEVEAKAADLQAKATTLEVDALVGVKFGAGIRDKMLELALTNRTSFDIAMAAIPDMPLLGGPVVPRQAATKSTAAVVGDDGAALAAILDKAS